jgi:2-keto-4-pentenoate hydratase/2-oxohepta-3-ene-1,7-dioic acid hydratase in catechol pathway
MKLVTYSKDEKISCGVLKGDGLVELKQTQQGDFNLKTMIDILNGGLDMLKEIEKIVAQADNIISLNSVKLLAPIPRPAKVIGLAGNYAEHIKEAGLKLGLSQSPRLTTVPRPFIMPSTVVIGPGDEIQWPDYSKTIDYEIELGVVIGSKAKYVTADKALSHVAGFMIVNDISARSVTFSRGRQKRPWDEFYDWLIGKWADGFFPTGPFIATFDEIDNVQNLNMTLKVNGKVRQQSNTSRMIYPAADIIEFLSHIMTFEPGDVIATGTPAGVGMATGDYLKAGDTIEATIDGLGTLTNRLSEPPQTFYEPLVK